MREQGRERRKKFHYSATFHVYIVCEKFANTHHSAIIISTIIILMECVCGFFSSQPCQLFIKFIIFHTATLMMAAKLLGTLDTCLLM